MKNRETDKIQLNSGLEIDKGETEGRLKYEKPRILFRQDLEAVAAVCDPSAGGKDVVPDNCNLFAGS